MKSKYTLTLLSIILVAFTFISIAPLCADAAEKKITLKVAGIAAPDYRGTKSLYAIKDFVEKKTEGRVILDIFPANQLGDYTQVFEEIRRGTIEMGLIFLPSQFDPILEIGSLPFLADTGAGMKKQLSPGSVVYSLLDESLDKLGVKLLRVYGDGFIGVGLTKNITNPTEAGKPKDAMIRVAPVAVYKETAEALGFRATTIPYADTYNGMQTGVCDGWIGGSSQINYVSFRDVLKYYVPYNCLFDQTAYLIGKEVWEKISPADRDVILEAVNIEADKSFADSESEDLEYQDKLAENGITIIKISPDEMAKIAKHVRDTTWPNLGKIYGQDIMDKIKASM